MTRNTRDGTDAATASKILRGIRARVERLERRDEHTEDHVRVLRTHSETAHIEDVTAIEAIGFDDPGFGITPFGEAFGDPGNGEAMPTLTTWEITNTTTIGYHRYLARCTMNESVPGEREFPPRPNRLAVGTGTDSFEWTNTELNNRIGSVPLVEGGLIDDNRTAVLRAAIVPDAFVGHTITEIGVVSDVDNRLFNHAQVDPPLEKTGDVEATVEVRLTPTDVNQ